MGHGTVMIVFNGQKHVDHGKDANVFEFDDSGMSRLNRISPYQPLLLIKD